MASTSSSSIVDITSMPFGLRRNFINIMPLNVLTGLRERSDTAKSLSKFRGEFVKHLNVQTDSFNDHPWVNFTPYSTVLNRQFNTTPLERLTVHMGPDVDPEALLSKMEKVYRDLYLLGDYHWTNVIAFLHSGVEIVNLKGTMNLPVDETEEFLECLMKFNVKKICFYNDNCKQSWLPNACEIINKHIGTTMKSVELIEGYFPKIEAVTCDSTVIEFVGPDFGSFEYETDIVMDEEFIDEEMEVV